jgi:hypothetical protein
VRSTFEHEWLFELLRRRPGFHSKRMFGGLAGYLHGRMMMVLVEPTRTGRWKWHGVLVCTDAQRQPAILAQFPQFQPHEVLKKWLYLDSHHEEFEEVMEAVAIAMGRNDPRFGVVPRVRSAAYPRRSE